MQKTDDPFEKKTDNPSEKEEEILDLTEEVPVTDDENGIIELLDSIEPEDAPDDETIIELSEEAAAVDADEEDILDLTDIAEEAAEPADAADGSEADQEMLIDLTETVDDLDAALQPRETAPDEAFSAEFDASEPPADEYAPAPDKADQPAGAPQPQTEEILELIEDIQSTIDEGAAPPAAAESTDNGGPAATAPAEPAAEKPEQAPPLEDRSYDDGDDAAADSAFVDALGIELEDVESRTRPAENTESPAESASPRSAVITPEQIEAAMEQAVKKMAGGNLETMLAEAVERVVLNEMEAIKSILVDHYLKKE